jgi:hypothetical protein
LVDAGERIRGSRRTAARGDDENDHKDPEKEGQGLRE